MSASLQRLTGVVLAAAIFAGTLALRITGVSTGFWMLQDQIRDWGLVQGSFTSLPLVGPGTHVGGYTIGPAFYWILWAIRVSVGPWFDNLPHGGGIGQAALQSGVDVLLLFGVWRRTRSVWTALAVVLLVATAGFDLSLAGIIWNPVMGSTLAKAAVALVLLDWHRGRTAQVATTVALAWMAVHAYTGAIYVTVAVLIAVAIDPMLRRSRPDTVRSLTIVGVVVLLLQVPYVLHQITTGFAQPAMGAVTGGLADVFAGRAAPQVGKSVAGLVGAFNFIQIMPWTIPGSGLLLVAAGIVVGLRYRRDPAILLMTLAPPLLAIPGYALFLGPLDHYYYFSLMPSFVLLIVLAATAWPWPAASRGVSVAFCVGALTMIPARLSFGLSMNRMPQYTPLVQGSRVVANRHVPMRAIQTAFPLPPTSSADFVYRLLGGRLERDARWIAIIEADGRVTYQDTGGG